MISERSPQTQQTRVIHPERQQAAGPVIGNTPACFRFRVILHIPPDDDSALDVNGFVVPGRVLDHPRCIQARLILVIVSPSANWNLMANKGRRSHLAGGH
jgi:hypothetical protein